jgi:RNA polymerase sigma-70 factor (ECF subfamily)
MRAQGGDREAIGQLWDAYTPKLYGFLVNTTRDPDLASDLAQRTWVKCMEALPTYHDRGYAFSAWLFAIARNECRQHWRKSNREVPLDLELHDVPDRDHRPAAEARDAVERALVHLHEDDRELLRLRYIADLPVKDIARILGISAVAAAVRLHRTQKRMRHVLER